MMKRRRARLGGSEAVHGDRARATAARALADAGNAEEQAKAGRCDLALASYGEGQVNLGRMQESIRHAGRDAGLADKKADVRLALDEAATALIDRCGRKPWR
jgi:hypothetical protein